MHNVFEILSFQLLVSLPDLHEFGGSQLDVIVGGDCAFLANLNVHGSGVFGSLKGVLNL
jgi:hypothetical protein